MKKQKLIICFLGNAESIHTLKWARYFADRGHEVYLISWTPFLKGYNPGEIKLIFLKEKIKTRIWPFNTLLNLPFYFFRLKKLIKKIKPDIVHAHYVTSYGILPALISFHPLVITAWGSDILITPKKFLPSRWTVKYALKKSDLITCDAEHMKKAMINLGADGSKIKIINFGIDTKIFIPGVKNEKLKEKFGILDCKSVISLRSLAKIHDIETLIKCIQYVKKEFPGVKFLIAGEGSEKERLKKIAISLSVFKNIIFLGKILYNEMPDYLNTADVYVSTSSSDAGIASSTAEAMACGLPVVITDVADNKSWVRNEEGGFLVPTKNPEILAEKIIYLLKNDNIRKEFGEINRKKIKKRNDYYKEMEKMEKIYYELIKTENYEKN
jgi:glycosyltransferase involved in cell wall biosynthesis